MNTKNTSIQEEYKQVQAAMSGDKTALSWMLDELTPVVQSRAARALLRYNAKSNKRSIQQEVEDLTQEIFLWLFENDSRILRSWLPEQGVPLSGFVGFIAHRKAMGIMRSQKRSPWTEEPTLAEELEHRKTPNQDTNFSYAQLSSTSSEDPEDKIASRQMLQLVIDELNDSLSPLGRFLFSLLYVEQRSVDEVGLQLGMTKNALYAWRSRLGRISREIVNQIQAKEACSGLRMTGS